MARTVILSDETVRALIEAHVSMAAWYYRMSETLHAAGVGVAPPGDGERQAHLKQLGQHFPELAAVAADIAAPRPYLPPPAMPAPTQVVENEGVAVAPPPVEHIATPAPVAPPAEERPPFSQGQPVAPPPIVDPTKVRYE